MNILLIVVATLAFSINGITTRFYQLHIQKNKRSINLYQAAFSIVAALAYIISGISAESFNAQLIIPGVLFGICFSGAIINIAKCNDMGYMSISSVIINLSMLFPVLFSWIILKEPIFINSVIGIGLLVVTFVFASLSPKKQSKGALKKWFVLVFFAFFANGMSAVIQKWYVVFSQDASIMLCMGVAYLTSALCFLLSFFKNNGKAEIAKYIITPKTVFLFMVVSTVSGLGSFLGNNLLAKLCIEVNGGILYPCVNGGLCVVSALASFVIFKEKSSLTKIITVVVGVCAIVLLNI